jgi:hypothetical protein
MKSIIAIIYSIILPIFSLKENIPKFCVNCKAFQIPANTDDKYGTCAFFPINNNNVHFLVTGIKTKEPCFYCSTARACEHLCGKEGKMYQQITSEDDIKE